MKNIPLLILGLCFATISAHADEAGPGFDCATASTKVEKKICSNKELSSLDLKLSQVYQQAQAETAGVDGETGEKVDPVATEQAQWLNTRNRCKSTQCLTRLYKKRIKHIETHWLTK
jgi:uncharacterized protein